MDEKLKINPQAGELVISEQERSTYMETSANTLVGARVTKVTILKAGSWPGLDQFHPVSLTFEKEGLPPFMLVVPAEVSALWEAVAFKPQHVQCEVVAEGGMSKS